MKIQQLIDQHLKQEGERQYTGKIGASCLGQCYRRTFWQIKREPQSNPPDERSLRIFHCGNLFHDFVQSFLKDYQVEQAYTDDTLSIRVDAVGEDEVVEIKSMHSRGFWYMDKELKEKSIKDVKPQHWMQVMCGALCFKKPFAHLVYVSKDDLCIKEFKISVSPEAKEAVEGEIAKIKDTLDKNLLPPALPRLYNGKECSYCSWKDKCKGEGK
ncbi:MAG: hypothetical protein EOM19_05300 [Candidatus Moranbacteria bacterium]|nr:hypothetical protein [Candidatus Moranbacteria bacterium]